MYASSNPHHSLQEREKSLKREGKLFELSVLAAEAWLDAAAAARLCVWQQGEKYSNTKLASLEESFRGREKAGIKRVRGKQRIFFFFWK